MVETQRDKLGGIKIDWKGEEKFFWRRLIGKFDLMDPLDECAKENQDIWYIWCNFQKGNKRIYSRLDRFYFNKNFFRVIRCQDGSVVRTTPYTLSDHHPIQATFSYFTLPSGNVLPFNNFVLKSTLLDREEMVQPALIISQFNKYVNKCNSLIAECEQNIQNWKNLFQIVGKKLAKDARREEDNAHQILHKEERTIQEEPHNV